MSEDLKKKNPIPHKGKIVNTLYPDGKKQISDTKHIDKIKDEKPEKGSDWL
jgi:hypothetical protein